MRNRLLKIIMASGMVLTLLGCQKEEPEKTDEEIMEELENAPEIIVPEEPIETQVPDEEPAEVEIGEGEGGSF